MASNCAQPGLDFVPVDPVATIQGTRFPMNRLFEPWEPFVILCMTTIDAGTRQNLGSTRSGTCEDACELHCLERRNITVLQSFAFCILELPSFWQS